MHFLIAGGSGYLGTALSAELTARGHTVTTLSRKPPRGPGQAQWDPDRGELDAALVRDADVVVSLCGSKLLGNPYSGSYRRELHDSRVVPTRLLATTIAEAPAGSRPALVCNNGSSYYGDHGGAEVTEASESVGDDLMIRVTREWEAATEPARRAGARVCVLRTAPVMSRGSAAMKVLVPLFKAGLGGRLSRGSQYFPVVSRRDWVGAAAFVSQSPDASGPFNICCPVTPTNAEFTQVMAALVRRPAVLAVPRFLLRVGAGPMIGELVRSMNLRPAALLAAGYEFADIDVRDVLADGVRRSA